MASIITDAKARQRFNAFLDACGMDRAEAARMLAHDRSLLDARNGIDETVLYFFAVENVLPAVQWLLDQGADVNTRDHADSIPLIDAAYLGHVEMCQLLLEHGADLSAQNQMEQNALSAATELVGKSPRSQERTLALINLLLERLGKDEDINHYFDRWAAEEALAREDAVAALLLAHGLKRPEWSEYDV